VGAVLFRARIIGGGGKHTDDDGINRL